MSKFAVVGKVVFNVVWKSTGRSRQEIHNFRMTEYALNVDDAICQVMRRLQKKYRDNEFYDIKDFSVLQVDVYVLRHSEIRDESR